jgi:hypothetical protein
MTRQSETGSTPPPFTGIEALVGAFAGGLLMALVQLGLDVLFAPANFRDGQYPVTYLVWTLPFGGVAGALAATALVLVERGKRRWAGQLCLAGGGVLGLVLAAAFSGWDLQHMPVIAGFYVVAAGLVGVGFAWAQSEPAPGE